MKNVDTKINYKFEKQTILYWICLNWPPDWKVEFNLWFTFPNIYSEGVWIDGGGYVVVYIAMLYVEMSVSWCNERVETKKKWGEKLEKNLGQKSQ